MGLIHGIAFGCMFCTFFAMAIQHVWKIDPSQSKIAFKVGYMQLGVITGEFRDFGGTVESSGDFDEMSIAVSVDSCSVTTFHRERDHGLLAADFFFTEMYRFIRFVSVSFRRVSSGGLFEVGGMLTIRDISLPVRGMVSMSSFSASEAVFKFSAMVSRKAFGLGGAGTADQDSVADEVDIFGEIRVCRC